MMPAARSRGSAVSPARTARPGEKVAAFKSLALACPHADMLSRFAASCVLIGLAYAGAWRADVEMLLSFAAFFKLTAPMLLCAKKTRRNDVLRCFIRCSGAMVG